jgi:hypothetical protein
MALLSANIIICENVLTEIPPFGGPVLTPIRVMGAITLPPGNNSPHFIVLTFLTSQPGDSSLHTVQVKITDKNGALISEAAPVPFQFGYLLDLHGPGGYNLKSEFTLNVTTWQFPVGCLVSALVDNAMAASTPLMLRRR